jgi:hypothetical protein
MQAFPTELLAENLGVRVISEHEQLIERPSNITEWPCGDRDNPRSAQKSLSR